MLNVLARNWWALVFRGLAAVVFGLLLFAAPGIGLAALIVLFACYALVDGLFNVIAAVRGARRHERWGVLLFEGLVSIAVGVLTFIWPGLTALALMFWIAAWAVVTGGLEITAALRLRTQIRGEWLLALSGIASIVFGVLLFLWPGAGALAVLFWIGAYAIVFGGLLMGLGFRLRALSQHEFRPPDRQVPLPV